MSAKGLPHQQDFICNDTRDMLDDLQLAAELGKTLLERNKELEVSLKQHQNVIDDQVQEIEYLTKQTVALREVSDSRLKIYEQLEVSIQDLERANHRLVLDNSAGKKHIKSLTTTIESLETKCEELQSTIDDLRLQVDGLKRRNATSHHNATSSTQQATVAHPNHVGQDDVDGRSKNENSRKENVKASPPKKTETATSPAEDEDMEQMSQMLAQLREVKTQSGKYQRRISELEEQLATVIQQNQSLENQVIQMHHHRDEDMKSMYDELNTLEEVRKGQMCSRCLRNVDSRTNDEDEDIPDDDDSSMLEALMSSNTPSIHRSSFSLEVQDVPLIKESNPNMLYKDLVDKYEALLEVHRHPSRNQNNKQQHQDERNNCVSLQEELQMSGDFTNSNAIINKDMTDDDESGHGDSLKPEKVRNNTKTGIPFSAQTPTDFSEAETSSSGFQDETSNKATQTEERPGSFLCTIADGEDCKFSIYDDATSPISSRFRSKPEYQELFKEIFMVLKNTTESGSSSSGMGKPDDHSTPKVMPVKPMVRAESPPPPAMMMMDMSHMIRDDDSQSVMSSTMSEMSLSQNEPTTVIENIIQAQNQPIPLADPEPQQKQQQHRNHHHHHHQQQQPQHAAGDQRILKPLIRQPLEYLSVEVRKRSSSRRKNKQADRSDSPMTHIIGSPKINYSSRPNSGRSRRGRDFKTAGPQEVDSSWNGHTVQFWSSNRSNIASPTPSQGSGKFEFKPSLASQDLHKLKKLDLSYAEVLRNADANKTVPPSRHQQQQRRKHHQN